jgi:hypothetical protein
VPQHGQGRSPHGQPQLGQAAIAVTSLRRERLHTPPLLRRPRRASLRRGLREQPGQLRPQPAKPDQLGVDLGQPLAKQRLGVAAAALTPVHDLQQLADLPQPQPDPLGALDERSRSTAAWSYSRQPAALRAGAASSPHRS